MGDTPKYGVWWTNPLDIVPNVGLRCNKRPGRIRRLIYRVLLGWHYHESAGDGKTWDAALYALGGAVSDRAHVKGCDCPNCRAYRKAQAAKKKAGKCHQT